MQSQAYAGDNGVTPALSYTHDPVGRVATITSARFGTQQYVYDADGRMTSSIEPNGGGVSDPATVGYSYYPDGKRSSVAVASATFNQANALTYSYRNDGVLTSQGMSGLASAVWTRAYTGGGRPTVVSGADTQAKSYNSAGQLSALALPGGTVSYGYDAEGSVISASIPNANQVNNVGTETETLTNTYDAAGQLEDKVYTPNS